MAIFWNKCTLCTIYCKKLFSPVCMSFAELTLTNVFDSMWWLKDLSKKIVGVLRFFSNAMLLIPLKNAFLKDGCVAHYLRNNNTILITMLKKDAGCYTS